MSSTPSRFRNPIAPCVLGAWLLAAAPALAEAPDVGLIPNGNDLGCANCHTNNDRNNPGAFNVWGQALLGLGGDVDWSRDCAEDGDGDGHSNGAELGDPDCVWMPGAMPAMPRSGHPGDPNIVPGDVMPPEPEPGEPEPGEPEPGEPEPGEPEPGEPEPGEPEPGEPEPGEPEPMPDGGVPGDPALDQGTVISLDDGCAVDPGSPASSGWLLLALVGLIWRRR